MHFSPNFVLFVCASPVLRLEHVNWNLTTAQAQIRGWLLFFLLCALGPLLLWVLSSQSLTIWLLLGSTNGRCWQEKVAFQKRQRDQGIYYSCPLHALKKFWSDRIHSDYGSWHISPSSTVPELTVLHANRSQLLLVSWSLKGTCWFPSLCPNPSIPC